MDISIIIVNWNTKDLLLDCLKSVYSTIKNLSFEIRVVDNGSEDGSTEAVRVNFPEVNLIENKENIGFARANNQALGQINGRYAVLLNSDIILTDGAIDTLVEFMEKNNDIGICGGQLLNTDNTKQNSIVNIPTLATELLNKSLLRKIFPEKYPGKELNLQKPVEVESIIGACMVVRKEAIDDVGLIDESYFFFLEETEWCLSFRKKGWKVYHHPEARIFHLQGQSVGKVNINARIEYWKSRYLFFNKNYGKGVNYVLKICLSLKLMTVLPFIFFFNLATLFSNEAILNKLKLYLILLLWHLKGLPDGYGLRHK